MREIERVRETSRQTDKQTGNTEILQTVKRQASKLKDEKRRYRDTQRVLD